MKNLAGFPQVPPKMGAEISSLHQVGGREGLTEGTVQFWTNETNKIGDSIVKTPNKAKRT